MACHSSAGPSQAKSEFLVEQFVIAELADPFAALEMAIDDVNHERPAFQHLERPLGNLGELWINDEGACLAMLQNERDRFRIEADIDGVEDGTGHRHTEMAFEHLRQVRREDGDRLAGADAAAGERARHNGGTVHPSQTSFAALLDK